MAVFLKPCVPRLDVRRNVLRPPLRLKGLEKVFPKFELALSARDKNTVVTVLTLRVAPSRIFSYYAICIIRLINHLTCPPFVCIAREYRDTFVSSRVLSSCALSLSTSLSFYRARIYRKVGTEIRHKKAIVLEKA